MAKLFRRFYYWLKRRQLDAELAEELELHRSMKQQELEHRGMPTVDATYASQRALGNVTLAREDARAIWTWPSLERLWQDVRFGVRLLKRQPTFAATAILTLAIGIGVTTTVFSVVEFEIWKPLPFPQPDQLVAIYTTGPGPRSRHERASLPELVDLRTRTRAFDAIAGLGSRERRILRGRTPAESLTVMPVTANFFSVLQRPVALGRAFDASDATDTSDAIVLSDGAWRRVFAADPQIVGKGVVLDGRSHTVVGITSAASLEFISAPDIFVPIDTTAVRDRKNRELNVIARLKQGVTIAAADADVRAVAQQLAHDHPLDNGDRAARLEGLRESYTGSNWRPLFFFLGAALFVLGLTCVNVASLLLARALSRDREFAIRRALGGGQAALTRQLLVEGGLLALPSAVVALLLVVWAVDLLPRWLPDGYLSRGTGLNVDVRVYLFALGVAALTAVLFGLAPAVLTSRRDLNTILAPGRTVAGSRRQRRGRHMLVVGEVTMALVLIVGAGLFVNSFVRMTRVPLGFEPQNRIALSMTLPRAAYPEAGDVVRFANTLLGEIRALPGVQTAALANSLPLGSGSGIRFVAAHRPRPKTGEEPDAIIRAISPSYFRTLGIRFVSGRDIADQDVTGAPAVAVINEHLARRLFADANPVGQELVVLESPYSRWVRPGTVQIVGVVANIKDVGINEVDFNDIFVPLAQHAPQSLQIVLHSGVPPDRIIDSVRQAITKLDRDLPLLSVKTMDESVDKAFQGAAFNVLLIGTFAALAIVMAAVGIYGAMAYAIEQRTKEFGVRLALGARPAGILGLALGDATGLGTVGIALGLAISLVMARLLGTSLYMVPRQHDGVLYDVSLSDPLTLTCACLLLLAVAALAGLVPARRAMRVDPVVALRAE
jgi:putative ABC transport system permease protein